MDYAERKALEAQQFQEVQQLLPFLLDKKLITDLEFRRIASTRKPEERLAAVNKVVGSKSRQTGEEIQALFATGTGTLTVAVSQIDEPGLPEAEQNADNSDNGAPNINPLLVDVISRRLFEFLAVGDIKVCRLVCRRWNSNADSFFRKVATVRFCADLLCLQPSLFMDIFKFSKPDVPFISFSFANCEWLVQDLALFFANYGKNIKKLKLDRIRLKLNSNRLRQFDVSSWINSLKLTTLTINCSSGCSLEIKIESLISVKFLTLECCTILIATKSAEDDTVKPAPLEISLIKVNFKGDAEILQNCSLAEFFDFTQTKKIVL